MSEWHAELVRRRDQALRDLVDMDDQVSAGELAPQAAVDLRRRYEAEAASAIAALTLGANTTVAVTDASEETSGSGARPRRPRARHVMYAFGMVAAAAAIIMVPKFAADRPPGGFVTGNEVREQPGGSSPPRDPASQRPSLASVSDAEMEKVVEANPDILGMRLALAERYVDKGRYDLAVVHYTTVLETDPDNAEAQAHLGWVMLQLDRPQEAAKLLDRAIASDSELLDALWFQANVRLYGLEDAEGALATLDKMRARQDLTPVVLRQVEQLRSTALDRLEGER